MSTSARTLPEGWAAVLDGIQARLDQAVTSANVRIEQLSHAAPESVAEERRREIAQWDERLRRLSAQLESAEQVVQSVDEVLAREESQLRQQIALCETLRQKAS